jgi:hypothetical protein
VTAAADRPTAGEAAATIDDEIAATGEAAPDRDDAATGGRARATGGATSPVGTGAGRSGRWWTHPRAVDVWVITGYLLAAVVLTGRLWSQRDRMVYADNDQMLFEWMLARAARAVTHLENPLYSTQLNAPGGLNLMANTSVLGLGVPLSPVTLLFGSQTTFLVILVGSLAGTAAAWYLFISRRLVRSRFAAALGGLFCGFAPGMISQACGHLHMIAQFLVPAILWVVFSPATGRVLRRGLLLGVLVAYQAFVGEEVLAFLVLAAGLFTVAYAVADRATARRLAAPFLGRLGVAGLTASALLAYPLWFQFSGPGHYEGLPFDPASYAMDLSSFSAMARMSITGHDAVPGHLSPNMTEENSFFGLGLIVLGAVVVVWLWRRPLVQALAVCGVVFAALSLGPDIRSGGQLTGWPGPYRWVAGLPLIDLAVPARFPLICIPVLAILLALSLDRVYGQPRGGTVPVRLLWTGAVAAVLLPLVPMPIRAKPAWPVPDFVATGEWRAYVPPGRTIVPVPPTTGGEAKAGMYWSARTGLAFTAPGGYFIGPRGEQDRGARWGAPDRPTALLLDRAASTGKAQPVTEEDRRQAVEDLRYWRAAVVVQGGLTYGNAVKQTVEALIGPGRMISGAWVWDVRDLVG